MSDEPAPEFDRAEHTFTKGEKVYVIDPNGYDIWEAEITEVKENSVSVHYPEYPEDDGEIQNDTKRVLAQSKKNKKIFEDQEAVRNEKDNEEEQDEEDQDYVEDDDDEKPKKK